MTILRDQVRAIVAAGLASVGETMALIPGVDHEAFTTDGLIDSMTSEWMAQMGIEGESCV